MPSAPAIPGDPARRPETDTENGHGVGQLPDARRSSTAHHPDMTIIAFPGHAGRCWPLLGWRLVARIGEVVRQ
jgi:hypothetical protein